MKRSILFSVALSFLLVAFAISAQAQAKNVNKATVDNLQNSLQWGGYYEFEYEDIENAPGDIQNGDFDQHRNILFFGVQPHERIKFFNELEIEHGGAPDVKFEQAWLDFKLNENHSFRGGIDLIPVGRLNINHDGNLRDFVFRPQTDGVLIPTTWFESGISFHGQLSERVDYQVGVSNGVNSSSAGDTGTKAEFESMVGSSLDESDGSGNKAVWGRVKFSPQLGTEIAVSSYQTDYDGAGNSIQFTALDLHHIRGPWEFKGEWVDVDKDQQDAADGSLEGGSGGYLEAAYHFFPDGYRDSWFAKGFDNPTFTALARYEDLTFDEDSSRLASLPAEEDFKYYSIGLNYRPMEKVAFKASYDIDDEEAAGTQDQDRVGFGMVIGY